MNAHLPNEQDQNEILQHNDTTDSEIRIEGNEQLEQLFLELDKIVEETKSDLEYLFDQIKSDVCAQIDEYVQIVQIALQLHANTWIHLL